MSEEKIITGIAASDGIAVGEAVVIDEEGDYCPIRTEIPKESIKKEMHRYKAALSETKKGMAMFKNDLDRMLGKQYTTLADAYGQILDDPILTREVLRQIQSGINAEYALYAVIEKVIKSFMQINDPYFRDRKNDIQDISNKVMSNLLGHKKSSISDIKSGSIVVSKNLTPNDTLKMQQQNVSGFVTEMGGKTSHASILAQTLEIPAVVGAKGALSFVKTGDTVIIDGTSGKIILNPGEELVKNYLKEKEKFVIIKKEYEKIKDLPAQTFDGKKIEMLANFDNPQELSVLSASGAEGIGLFRTEYLYLGRAELPSEEELFENYMLISKRMLPNSVTIRTLDLGGDKINDPVLGYQRECPTFLGLRSIRLCLKYPNIFVPQLRAILRASAVGKIKIMFPMISGVAEFLAAKKILVQVKADLKTENIAYDENIEVGAMIEVPSAALACDFIAQEADFLSVGTNDLIQYTLAVERTDEAVANLYEPENIAVLRLLKQIVSAARRANIKVSMCGEMASEQKYTGILVGLGFDELSVPPSSIGKIKKEIRSMNAIEKEQLVQEILAASSVESLRQELKKIM